MHYVFLWKQLNSVVTFTNLQYSYITQKFVQNKAKGFIDPIIKKILDISSAAPLCEKKHPHFSTFTVPLNECGPFNYHNLTVNLTRYSTVWVREYCLKKKEYLDDRGKTVIRTLK
jgi:hypothetical protein